MTYLQLLCLPLFLTLILGCAETQDALFANEVTQVTQMQVMEKRESESHTEYDLLYPTTDTTLGGTLYLPPGNGPFPVILFHFGSNGWERANTPVGYPTNLYRDINVGLFFYDRRGLGESGGVCCEAEIERLAGDVLAGVEALSQIPEVDANKIGLFGFSQGGWVVPNAASRSNKVAFTIVGSGGGVSIFEEDVYSHITGDEACERSDLSETEIDDLMANITPGGYNPYEDLTTMTQPAYWYYGEDDTSHPVRQVKRNLTEIQQTYGKNWQIQIFENANHEFLLNSGPCVARGKLADTFTPLSEWLLATLEQL